MTAKNDEQTIRQRWADIAASLDMHAQMRELLFGDRLESEGKLLKARGELIATELVNINKLNALMENEGDGVVTAPITLSNASTPYLEPPLRFDPTVSVKDDEGNTHRLLDLVLSSKEGTRLLPVLLDAGLGHSKLSSDQFFQLIRRQPDMAIFHKWLDYFPEHLHSVDKEMNDTIVDYAIAQNNVPLLELALGKGFDFDTTRLPPLVVYESANQNANGNFGTGLLITLAKHGFYYSTLQSINDPTSDITAGVLLRSGKHQFFSVKEPFVTFHKNLERQAEGFVKQLKDTSPRYLPAVLDDISAERVNMVYACNMLPALCSPNIWKGNIDKLYKLSLKVPPAVQQAIYDAAPEALHDYAQQMSQSGTQISGPFDLGETVHSAPCTERGGGNG